MATTKWSPPKWVERLTTAALLAGYFVFGWRGAAVLLVVLLATTVPKRIFG